MNEIRIYAKFGTNEKVLLVCESNKDYQKYLGKKYGGDWIFVEPFNYTKELLKFNDEMIYEGFNPFCKSIIRYSSAIEKIDFEYNFNLENERKSPD